MTDGLTMSPIELSWTAKKNINEKDNDKNIEIDNDNEKDNVKGKDIDNG